MNDFVKIAREAVETFTQTGETIRMVNNIDQQLTNIKAGVFVTIHKKLKKDPKKSELRGCIGTFLPTKTNIVQEIIGNAISACSRDYRFSPITKDELDKLKIKVDVLSKPQLIDDISKLDPRKYGVLIKSENDSRSGLLLPDLEGVDTIHDQIAIALKKAGINKNEPVKIYSFTITRYKED